MSKDSYNNSITTFVKISGEFDEIKNRNNEDMFLKEGNALVLGQTGSGKTTLINELLNINVKQISSLNPTTSHITMYKSLDIENLKLLKLIDTIGFSDLNKNNSQIYEKIKNYLTIAPISYVNEILLVIKCDRFSKQEELDIISFLKKMHEDCKNITSICFTHCKQKEIDYQKYYDDIMHRDISKYIGKNIYFTDIDLKRNDKTSQVIRILKEEMPMGMSIHFNKIFDSPFFGHRYEANKPKIYYE